MEEDKEIDKLNFDIDQLINKCIILNKDELTATARLMLGRDIILRFINILQKNKYLKKENEELMELKISASAEYQIHNLQEENEELKNAIAVANKLEERIKENFVPKEKIENIIEEINVYKKIAKESIEQSIVIADNDSLEYGRMQAHSADMSMLQKLLESEE